MEYQYLHTKEINRCWHLMSCLPKKPSFQDSRLSKGSKWPLVAGQPSPSVNLSLSRKLSFVSMFPFVAWGIHLWASASNGNIFLLNISFRQLGIIALSTDVSMNFLDGQCHFDFQFLHHVARPPASSEHNRCPSCDAHHPGPYDINNTCIYIA